MNREAKTLLNLMRIEALLGFALVLWVFSLEAKSQELVEFNNGEVADAADINANFQILKDSIERISLGDVTGPELNISISVSDNSSYYGVVSVIASDATGIWSVGLINADSTIGSTTVNVATSEQFSENFEVPLTGSDTYVYVFSENLVGVKSIEKVLLPNPPSDVYEAEFTSAFGGAIIEDDVFLFPSDAESWAGFSNEADIYPLSFNGAGEISFTAAAASPTSIYFRFEYLPFPDNLPDYTTETVLIGSSEMSQYSVEVPSQGTNTFSVLYMFIVERDAPVEVTNVEIVADP